MVDDGLRQPDAYLIPITCIYFANAQLGTVEHFFWQAYYS